jgi:hypothetical protein
MAQDVAVGARLSRRPRLLRPLPSTAIVVAEHQFMPTTACTMTPEKGAALLVSTTWRGLPLLLCRIASVPASELTSQTPKVVSRRFFYSCPHVFIGRPLDTTKLAFSN